MNTMVAASAGSPLREFNEAGVLDVADVQVARRLGRLAGETEQSVVLAVALTVRALRNGSVCLDLARLREITVEGKTEAELAELPWPEADALAAALRVSPLVAGGPEGPLKPLVLAEGAPGSAPLLYLSRYFDQEQAIGQLLDARAKFAPAVDADALRARLDKLFTDQNGQPTPAPDRQRVAAALSATRFTTVIAGGPGTGKTHTVARIIALACAEGGVRVGLAAPTGKAAARLQEAINQQRASLEDIGLPLPDGLEATTLHRLLGVFFGTMKSKYSAANPLPYDLVVVDETSMVPLTMMYSLLRAMRPGARLVLVGDPDQLESVEAGAVLSDLVERAGRLPAAPRRDDSLHQLVGADLAASGDPNEAAFSEQELQRLAGGVVRLSRGRRFGGAIATLAVAVRKGDGDAVMEILQANADAAHGASTVSFDAPEYPEEVAAGVKRAAAAAAKAAENGDAEKALAALGSHLILCAHREGPQGARVWNARALEWASEAAGRRLDPHAGYPGQPILVVRSDHELGVANGDVGVVVRGPDGLRVAFHREKAPLLLHASQLPETLPAYAMTIHRSQGSQYGTVAIVLPDEKSQLLGRGLLYTAITRAKEHVRLIGTEQSVRAGVAKDVQRASGLRR